MLWFMIVSRRRFFCPKVVSFGVQVPPLGMLAYRYVIEVGVREDEQAVHVF